MPKHDDCTEYLASRVPVVVRRRVLWGECDPAQVVYTPRFSDYMVTASRWFLRVVVDAEEPILARLRLGTPMKAMNLVFHGVLRPDDWFEMTVKVAAVHTRTFDLSIEAKDLGGQLRFVGQMTPIIVDADRFESIAIPEVMLERIERYRIACEEIQQPITGSGLPHQGGPPDKLEFRRL